MNLVHAAEYERYGIDAVAQSRLSALGDLILSAPLNVTGIKDPAEIERVHFLDSLSLLELSEVRSAVSLADVGSGGGLPALVLALVSPETKVTAIESIRKKCDHIGEAASALGLSNLHVCCARAEDCARTQDREAFDVVVSRAVASLPVVAEYSMPLVRLGGHMVAMKGVISDQERTHALAALGILGSDGLDVIELHPFAESRGRLAYVAKKTRMTPATYPRRAGVPQKRPLGQ